MVKTIFIEVSEVLKLYNNFAFICKLLSSLNFMCELNTLDKLIVIKFNSRFYV